MVSLSPKRVLVLAALMVAGSSRAHDRQLPAPPGVNEKLRAELLVMGDADAAWIRESLGSSQNVKRMANEHLGRILRLKEIIRRYGWPTISLVGVDGASAAWITVQHSDDNPAFQRSVVPLIEAAAMAKEARLKHMACLTDRVLTASRQPQIYGTQGAPVATADRAAVNARRKGIGLPPLEEYWQSIGDGTGTTTCRR
jgi:hypothetical protein